MMKGAASLFAATILAVSVGWGAHADEIDLSSAKIVRARKENPQQKLAADELEKHLRLVCGWNGDGTEGGFTFVFAKPKGFASNPYTAHAKRAGNTIYFWGDDTGTKKIPYYGSAFAVYGFFETVLGVKWVSSGDDGIVFTPRGRVELPPGWSYSYRCPAKIASIRRADKEWARRLRYATLKPFRYGHAFRDWQDRYKKDHPEYLGLAPDGMRGVKPAWKELVKLCLSNPDVPEVVVSNWVARGMSRYRYLNICPNDGSPGYCVCPGCLALDADRPGEPFLHHKTDRDLNFWNRVVARAREVRPDVMAITYIYSFYRLGPRREKIAFPDNMLFGMVPGMNDDYQADFATFRAAGLKNFFFRPNYLAYHGRLPRGLERYIYDTFHFYQREGSIGYDYDGCPSPDMSLEYYVTFRQTAFPDLTFDAIIDEWCSQFGDAASAAKSYYERIRSRAEPIRARIAARMNGARESVLDDSELSGTVVAYHSVEALTEDLAALERADVTALSPVERRRFDALKDKARLYLAIFPKEVEKTRESVRRGRSWKEECRSFSPTKGFR